MLLARFVHDRSGSIAPLLALTIVPIIGIVGAGMDYSRASAARVGLQAALGSALLYAAKEDSSTWQAMATNASNTVVAVKHEGTVATPVFHWTRMEITPARCRRTSLRGSQALWVRHP